MRPVDQEDYPRSFGLKLDLLQRGSFRRICNPEVDDAKLAEWLRKEGATNPDKKVDREREYLRGFIGRGAEHWRSSEHIVRICDAHAENAAIEGWCAVLWLRVWRHDGERIADHWRTLQRIKNELVHPECQGIEFYPPESVLQDGENSYHLWVLPPNLRLPFGMGQPRNQGADIGKSVPGRFIREASAPGQSK